MRYQIKTSITVETTGTEFTTAYTNDDVQGKVWYAVLQIPAYTNTVNTTLTVDDQYDQQIYASSAVAKDSTTIVVLPHSGTSTTSPFPLMPGYTFKLTLGGAAGGTSDYTAYLTLWVEK